jgi:zinc transport system ATP-binding protein
MDIVDLRSVSVEYGPTLALDDISLRVFENDFLALIGPNGGGKTTILKAILGLVAPSKGEVTVFGGKPSEARGRIGYVPQHTLFDMSFPISVWEVALAGTMGGKGFTGKYSRRDKDVALDCLDRVGMGEYRGRPIGDLSGGQRQRVLIARALASRPRLLLLDEPTASVDTQMESQFYELLGGLNDEVAIVLATHDIGVVSSHIKNLACVNQTLSYHPNAELDGDTLEGAYKCPVEMIAHGMPHRVLREHKK